MINAVNSFADSSIHQMCSKTRPIDKVESPQDFSKAICDLKNVYQDDVPIQKITTSILKTLEKLIKSTNDDWTKNEVLNFDLEHLKDRLNQHAEGNSDEKAGSDLEKALFVLNAKWGDKEERTKKENKKKYYDDLKKVLALTPTGKKVIKCYAKSTGPLISGDAVVELPDEYKDRGAKMAFGVIPDNNDPNKVVKRMFINTDLDPIEALPLLAHELKHGCHAKEMSEILLPLYNADDDSIVRTKLKYEYDQERAVDEMRAYKVTVDLFKDLAKVAPNMVCGKYFTSVMFGNQPINTAEYAAAIDDKLTDGSFPKFLISLYAAHGDYNPENVFVKDKNSIRPDLLEKLKKEGVHVTP